MSEAKKDGLSSLDMDGAQLWLKQHFGKQMEKFKEVKEAFEKFKGDGKMLSKLSEAQCKEYFGDMGLMVYNEKQEQLKKEGVANVGCGGSQSSDFYEFPKSRIDEIFQSVVCVCGEEKDVDDRSTGIVFDIYKSDIYLVVSLHFLGSYRDNLSKDFQKKYDQITKRLKLKKCDMTNNDKIVLHRVSSANPTSFHPPLPFVVNAVACWKADVGSDFAILKLACSPELQHGLVPAKLSYELVPTMRVWVFGFPGHTQLATITPCSVTGIDATQFTLSSLSAPGQSCSAIVADRVVADSHAKVVGYLGGNWDAGGEAFQMYAFRLEGLGNRPSFPKRKASSDESEDSS